MRVGIGRRDICGMLLVHLVAETSSNISVRGPGDDLGLRFGIA